MRTICIKTKIKPEFLDDVHIWFKTLIERLDETMDTLKNEDVLIESAFLDQQGDDFYLIYYLKAVDINKVYEIFDKSTSPIDLYFKDCWKKYCVGRTVLKELIDLERI